MIDRGVPNIHPDSSYYYEVDWAPALDDGVTISTSAWDVPTGLQQDAVSQTSTKAGIKLSVDGGTVGEYYDLTCTIGTSTSETLNQVLRVRVGYEGY